MPTLQICGFELGSNFFELHGLYTAFSNLIQCGARDTRFCKKLGNSKPCCISNQPLFPDLFSAFEPTMDQWAQHNHKSHSTVSELTCTDCSKLFKSKRSLFGHRKEKHSGVVEVHTCPECGKTFGRKSNLKAHRESVHYGKK